MVPQLEQMIKSKMVESLAARVDMSSETDVFMDLVAYAMKVLVSGIVDRLDTAFKTMAAINWAGDSQVIRLLCVTNILNPFELVIHDRWAKRARTYCNAILCLLK